MSLLLNLSPRRVDTLHAARYGRAVTEAAVSNPISRVLQRHTLRANVRRTLESGVGLYHTTWRIESDVAIGDDLAMELIAWCRDALGEMHRPYGMDYVTLALAALNEEDNPVASVNYGVLRPQDFYSHGPAETQIRSVIREWAETEVLSRGGGGRLSAVLFSWGDLTSELLATG